MKRDYRRDPVVTGMGAVTPFGIGIDTLWDGISNGRNAVDWIDLIPELDESLYPVRYAGEVKRFVVDQLLVRHCDVRRERSVQMGLVAAREAMHQARLLDASDQLVHAARRIEVIVGSAGGPCHEAEVGYSTFYRQGPRAVSAKTIPNLMFNSLSSNLSIHFGAIGTNFVLAAACAAGASAIGLAALLIRHGYADIVLTGGADSCLTPAYLAYWTNLRILAQNTHPERASRPFDRQRNGFVLGEGAAIVVMESRESAEKRQVAPLASIRGYGHSSDAHHITAPSIAGQMRAIESCLNDANIRPEQVDYISAHGTGTKLNDETEAHTILNVFGRRVSTLPVSSIKSMLGHALGAGGAIEFVACIKSMQKRFVPPTANCEEPDPDIGIDYVPIVGRPHPVRFAMSNSFGFGGSNAVLLLESIS